MNQLKIKSFIKTLLPKSVFNFLINAWRNTYIKYINRKRTAALKTFTKPFFKKLNILEKPFFLYLDPRNGYVDEEIYLNGAYEKDIYKIMSQHVHLGDTFVDIGANIGMYTNYIPKIVGARGKVIACEPIERIYDQNLSSIKKNNYTNVVLYNFACSNKNSNEKIYFRDGNIGGSHIGFHLELGDMSEQSESIKTIVGDELLRHEKKINFMKIDTEGHELEVLQGLEKTIIKHRPKIIIEFSPYLYTSDQGLKILEFISTYYSDIYVVEKNKYLNLKKDNDKQIFFDLNKGIQYNLLLEI